jgi:outer membrane protein OmpA-like peptidoglycan-associated protein
MHDLKFYKLLLVMFLLPFLGGVSLHAQTAEEIDALLENREVSYAQAVAFVLAAAELVQGDLQPETAFTLAAEKGWLPKKVSAGTGSRDAPIKLNELSFLVMKSFGLKGSFLYSLFPGPRYAYRELAYLQMLPEPGDPAMKVSGLHLMYTVEQVLNHIEDEKAVAQEAEAAAARRKAEREEVQRAAAEKKEAELAAAEAVRREAEREAAQRAERTLMMNEIHAQLEKQEVADTTVRVVDEGVVISLSNIQFGADSTVLLESERVKIQEIALILSEYPGRNILVGGHTALAGSEEGRIRISTERARAVADYLVLLGCRKAEEIRVRGYGAEIPVADNSTAAGQAMNRRVEIIILDRQ